MRTLPFAAWYQPYSVRDEALSFVGSGGRLIPYVSFYKGPFVSRVHEDPMWGGGSPGRREVLENPFWQSVNLDNHPEWALAGPDGRRVRPFGSANYPVGWEQVCVQSAGYIEAALQGVKGLMDDGAAGVLIDNLHPTALCWGAGAEGHRHVERHATNASAFLELLERVYHLIKSYGEDKLVVLNGAHHHAYAQFGDVLLLESHVVSWASDDWRGDAAVWLSTHTRFEPYLKTGKRIVSLNYLGHTARDIADEAMYSASWAFLLGYLWCDAFSLVEDSVIEILGGYRDRYAKGEQGNVEGVSRWRRWMGQDRERRLALARRLYGVSLGRSLGPIAGGPTVFHRRFERGWVIVNSGKEPAEWSHPWPAESPLYDVETGELVGAAGGVLKVRVEGEHGRILTTP